MITDPSVSLAAICQYILKAGKLSRMLTFIKTLKHSRLSQAKLNTANAQKSFSKIHIRCEDVNVIYILSCIPNPLLRIGHRFPKSPVMYVLPVTFMYTPRNHVGIIATYEYICATCGIFSPHGEIS